MKLKSAGQDSQGREWNPSNRIKPITNATSGVNLPVWNVAAVIHKLQKMRHLENVELNNSYMCGFFRLHREHIGSGHNNPAFTWRDYKYHFGKLKDETKNN